MIGSAVGKKLTDHDLKVLTSLTGRSAETVQRARDAGMQTASNEQIARDFANDKTQVAALAAFLNKGAKI